MSDCGGILGSADEGRAGVVQELAPGQGGVADDADEQALGERPGEVGQAARVELGAQQAGPVIAQESGGEGGVDDGAQQVDLGEQARVAEDGGPQVEDAKAVAVGEVVLDTSAQQRGEAGEAGVGGDDDAAQDQRLAAQDGELVGVHITGAAAGLDRLRRDRHRLLGGGQLGDRRQRPQQALIVVVTAALAAAIHACQVPPGVLSGAATRREHARAHLEVFGKVFVVGPEAGQAQLLKLLNNMLSSTALAITAVTVARWLSG